MKEGTAGPFKPSTTMFSSKPLGLPGSPERKAWEKRYSDERKQNEEVAKIDLEDNETLDKIIDEAIDWLNTFRQGKVLYAPNEQSPYTGWAKAMWGNGQTQLLIQYKDGKMDGPSMQWHSNGQKSSELIRKDDKLITAVVWKPNGGKCPVTNVVDGNGVVVVYNEDGTEDRRATYQDGKEVFD